MTAESVLHGRRVRYDTGGGCWVWTETGEPVPDAEGLERTCEACDRVVVTDEPDPCLGRLPGVAAACCGHGDPLYAYIMFEDGVTVREFTAVENGTGCPWQITRLNVPEDEAREPAPDEDDATDWGSVEIDVEFVLDDER